MRYPQTSAPIGQPGAADAAVAAVFAATKLRQPTCAQNSWVPAWFGINLTRARQPGLRSTASVQKPAVLSSGLPWQTVASNPEDGLRGCWKGFHLVSRAARAIDPLMK